MPDSVKNLSVTLACHLTMKTHISDVVHSSKFELYSINSICPQVSQKFLFLPLLFHALTTAILSCLAVLSISNKLQKVQNNAACLVLRVPKTDHISSPHHHAFLHWLPIDSWIQHRLDSQYSRLNLTASVYFTELLAVYKPTCQLCSPSGTSILCLPSVHTHSLGQRSFSYDTSSVWKSLPWQVRSSNTLASYKSSLKSNLFKLSYWLCVCVRACMLGEVCFDLVL